MNITNNRIAQITAMAMVALIILCAIWESVGAPLRPGGTFFVFKGIFLLPFVTAIWHGQRKTFMTISLVILLYLLEGLTRTYADVNPISRWYAAVEVALGLTVFVLANIYLKRSSTVVRAPRVRAVKSRLIFWVIALIWLQLLMPSFWQAQQNNETSYLVTRLFLGLLTGLLLLTYLFRLYQVSRATQKPSNHI